MVPVKVTFSKERMLGILDGSDVAEVVKDEVTGKRRWSIDHQLIFRLDGKLYSARYSVGATEQQDESPWEYENEVECTEVEAYEKTVTAYRTVFTESGGA